VNLTLERLVKQGEVDAALKKVPRKTLYIWSLIGSNPQWGGDDLIITQPDEPKQRRYRVSPDTELIRQLLSKKRTKLELKKKK